MHTFSIVTKTYNRLDLLRACVESVQAQTLQPYDTEIQWEHVIYDDGSTDGTPTYLAYLPPHVRSVRSSENEGISIAANRAIRTCQSKYIFELDSDDLILQRTLVNFFDTFKTHPEHEWIVADFLRIDAAGSYIVGKDYFGWTFKDTRDILQSIFDGSHFIQHNTAYSHALFDKVGGYDDRMHMAEDLELYVRFLLVGAMPRYEHFVSHLHRVHPGNYSRGVDLKSHRDDIVSIYKKHRSALIDRGITCPFTH